MAPAVASTATASLAASGSATAPNTGLPGFTLGKAGFQVSVLGNNGASAAPTGLAGLLQNQRQPQIFFAPTPAKTQRLLHSEAYIKYIENLDKPYQGNWERQLHATQETSTINDAQRLPINWLPAEYQTPAPPDVKMENRKDALQALWALRDIMVKDALCGRMNFVPSSRRSLMAPAVASTTTASLAASGSAAAPNTGLPGFTLGKAGFQVSVLGNNGASAAPTGLAGLLQNQRQPQIFFAPTPAKTQRLLHSEAYIKYIENLDKPYQGNWERQLHATQETSTINDAQRLPINWLPAEYQTPAPPDVKMENRKDALQALWALRDIMVKDALCGRM
ncbi:hypothetical protein FHG87_017174 [Trinorchestia longiramus]|nr:hypothetical protein FHG87_017174 [Trinorchestia longiramus]